MGPTGRAHRQRQGRVDGRELPGQVSARPQDERAGQPRPGRGPVPGMPGRRPPDLDGQRHRHEHAGDGAEHTNTQRRVDPGEVCGHQAGGRGAHAGRQSHGEDRPQVGREQGRRIAHRVQASVRMGMRTPSLPPAAPEAGEGSGQRGLRTVNRRDPRVGLHLPLAQDGVAAGQHQPGEGQHRRHRVGRGRGRCRRHHPRHQHRVGQQRDGEERPPQAHREVGQVDVPVGDVGQLVQDDGAEDGPVRGVQRQQPGIELDHPAARKSEGPPAAAPTGRRQHPARWSGQAGLGAQPVQIGHQPGGWATVETGAVADAGG